jgi:hypothetical protein
MPFQASPDPENGRGRARKKNYFCMEYSHNTTSTPVAKVIVTYDLKIQVAFQGFVGFAQMPRIRIFLAIKTTFSSKSFVGAKL